MVDDWVIKTMYATKRRRKNPKSMKPLGAGSRHEQNAKSNPSKRHRERLNSELEHLASLLPFEQNVIIKLDKLSILRLAVSYLRMKCYFQSISYDRMLSENRLVSHLYHCPFDLTRIEGEACLHALNGFIFIMSCDGEVFSVSRTVERYLGFHQADILHQSVLELIHSEDREEFRRQLSWKSALPPELQSCTLNELMTKELAHHLRRRFTVRFRCLLDNTSGFITLELSGRLQLLYGQARGGGGSGSRQNNINGAGSSAVVQLTQNPNFMRTLNNAPSSSASFPLPPLGLFAVCSPLGPMPSLSGPQRDITFKTKHQLDLTIVTADSRTKMLFNYTDGDLQRFKVYDLIHPEDLQYVAQGHKEVFRTGSIGLLVHRWLSKSSEWIWLQSRVKIVLKNGKQDHIVAIHRQLSTHEGMELLIRRSDEYKLPFPLLEPETLLSDEDLPGGSHSLSDYNGSFTVSQLKDFENSFIGGRGDMPTRRLDGYGLSSFKPQDDLSPPDDRDGVSHLASGQTSHYPFGDRLATGRHKDDSSLTRCPSRVSSCQLNFTSGQLSSPVQKGKVQAKNSSGHSKRKRNKDNAVLNKDTFKLDYSGLSGALGLPFGPSGLGNTSEFGRSIHPETFLRPDLHNFGNSLGPIGAVGPFGLPPIKSNTAEFDYASYYLGWRTTDGYETAQNPFLHQAQQMQQIVSPCLPQQDTGRQFVGSVISDSGYTHYPSPYDAYSAAMAAAAVVAAASQHQQQHDSSQLRQQQQQSCLPSSADYPSYHSPRFPQGYEHSTHASTDPEVGLFKHAEISRSNLDENALGEQDRFPFLGSNLDMGKTPSLPHSFDSDMNQLGRHKMSSETSHSEDTTNFSTDRTSSAFEETKLSSFGHSDEGTAIHFFENNKFATYSSTQERRYPMNISSAQFDANSDEHGKLDNLRFSNSLSPQPAFNQATEGQSQNFYKPERLFLTKQVPSNFEIGQQNQRHNSLDSSTPIGKQSSSLGDSYHSTGWSGRGTSIFDTLMESTDTITMADMSAEPLHPSTRSTSSACSSSQSNQSHSPDVGRKTHSNGSSLERPNCNTLTALQRWPESGFYNISSNTNVGHQSSRGGNECEKSCESPSSGLQGRPNSVSTGTAENPVDSMSGFQFSEKNTDSSVDVHFPSQAGAPNIALNPVGLDPANCPDYRTTLVGST